LCSDHVRGQRLAGRVVSQDSPQAETNEALVFVTGSRIPQRIKVSLVGMATYSPLRVIDREEIDRTGRLTIAGVLVNEPSLRVIGR
jgi:outer membrane cobalamin receptor